MTGESFGAFQYHVGVYALRIRDNWDLYEQPYK